MRQRHTFFIVFASLLLVATAGCASMESGRHQYLMRGQVLEVNAQEVLVCVGTSDGARAGQELTVYRFERTSGPRGAVNYRRTRTGSVQITEVADEHFAKARITSGSADVNSLVELSR